MKVFNKPVSFVVNPKKVLIKITQDEYQSLFSIYVTRADGQRELLFKDVEAEDGFERKFKQNLSVGVVVAVGENVTGIQKGDIAIIDYLVTATDDALVGSHKGYKLIAIDAVTTYHTSDSAPMLNGRKTWRKGDFNNISKLLGVIRMARLKSFHPYVFLEYIDPIRMVATPKGLVHTVEDGVCTRKVLAGSKESNYSDGDTVLVKEADLFFRTIDGKMISVVSEQDILAKI